MTDAPKNTDSLPIIIVGSRPVVSRLEPLGPLFQRAQGRLGRWINQADQDECDLIERIAAEIEAGDL